MKRNPEKNLSQKNFMYTPLDSNHGQEKATSSNIYPYIHQFIANKRITVAIEGNIAAGKTTLIDQLATEAKVFTIREPLEKWCNIDNINLLEYMYIVQATCKMGILISKLRHAHDDTKSFAPGRNKDNRTKPW